MRKMLMPLMGIPVLLLTSAIPLFAQGQPGPEKIPIKLQLVISRYNGERKISSYPYTMLAIANGDQVSFLNGLNTPVLSGTSTTYTNVGTSIICTVTTE